mmetsp:Transcript_8173/g.21051  ORF Transcript_8173/g.21051 Transcript_8173/m.21051 type:complete len:503 (-) Transcript_8173:540-2048(-)
MEWKYELDVSFTSLPRHAPHPSAWPRVAARTGENKKPTPAPLCSRMAASPSVSAGVSSSAAPVVSPTRFATKSTQSCITSPSSSALRVAAPGADVSLSEYASATPTRQAEPAAASRTYERARGGSSAESGSVSLMRCSSRCRRHAEPATGDSSCPCRSVSARMAAACAAPSVCPLPSVRAAWSASSSELPRTTTGWPLLSSSAKWSGPSISPPLSAPRSPPALGSRAADPSAGAPAFSAGAAPPTANRMPAERASILGAPAGPPAPASPANSPATPPAPNPYETTPVSSMKERSPPPRVKGSDEAVPTQARVGVLALESACPRERGATWPNGESGREASSAPAPPSSRLFSALAHTRRLRGGTRTTIGPSTVSATPASARVRRAESSGTRRPSHDIDCTLGVSEYISRPVPRDEHPPNVRARSIMECMRARASASRRSAVRTLLRTRMRANHTGSVASTRIDMSTASPSTKDAASAEQLAAPPTPAFSEAMQTARSERSWRR